MGLEGFSGLESILYHLHSPCRVSELGSFVPVEREEWVPDAHAHRHFHTAGVSPAGDEITGRRTLMWNDDVEISLCRPAETMDYFFRNGEGDEVIFVHEGSGTLETIFGDLPYREGDYVVVPQGNDLPVPAGRGPAAPRLRDARPDRDPAALPQPVGPDHRGGALLPPRHPSADGSADDARARRVPGEGSRTGRLPDLRRRLPPVRRGRMGRLSLSVDVLDPRLRADHRPDPPAAALAPDVRRPELRDLLVLPPQARLRPARGADPLPPLEPAVGGDDLLRLRQLRLPARRRRRLDHAPSLGAPPRAAAGARRAGARRTRDLRARGDVRHLPPARALAVRARARRRGVLALLVRQRTAERGRRPTAPGSRRISSRDRLRSAVDRWARLVRRRRARRSHRARRRIRRTDPEPAARARTARLGRGDRGGPQLTTGRAPTSRRRAYACRSTSPTTSTSTPRWSTRATSAGSSGPGRSRFCRTGAGCRSATTAAPARSRQRHACHASERASGVRRRRPGVRADSEARRRARARLRRRGAERPGEPIPVEDSPSTCSGSSSSADWSAQRHPGLGVPAARAVPRQVVPHVDLDLGDAALPARVAAGRGAAAGSSAASAPCRGARLGLRPRSRDRAERRGRLARERAHALLDDAAAARPSRRRTAAACAPATFSLPGRSRARSPAPRDRFSSSGEGSASSPTATRSSSGPGAARSCSARFAGGCRKLGPMSFDHHDPKFVEDPGERDRPDPRGASARPFRPLRRLLAAHALRRRDPGRARPRVVHLGRGRHDHHPAVAAAQLPAAADRARPSGAHAGTAAS